VLIGSRIGVMAGYKGHIMDALPFVPPKRKRSAPPKTQRAAISPPPEHAWKHGVSANIIMVSDRKYESEETYRETVRLIERALLGKNR
jgi:hypothetical protein